MTARVISANEYRRERWANGAGWTREILRQPAGDGGWDWRMSIAEIEQDAPFSHFPGVERWMVLLRGDGVRLDFVDGHSAELAPPHGQGRFHGAREVAARLQDGPVHVFNLMWRPAAVEARLQHRPLVGPMFFFVDPGDCWAVHLLAGRAGFDAGSGLPALEAGDTALLRGGEGRSRYLLEGGGELLAIRLRAAGTDQ